MKCRSILVCAAAILIGICADVSMAGPNRPTLNLGKRPGRLHVQVMIDRGRPDRGAVVAVIWRAHGRRHRLVHRTGAGGATMFQLPPRQYLIRASNHGVHGSSRTVALPGSVSNVEITLHGRHGVLAYRTHELGVHHNRPETHSHSTPQRTIIPQPGASPGIN